MKKLTDFEIYHLKGVAKQLPTVLSDTHEKHLVKGKDILEWGTITEIEGKPIEADKEYLWHYPVQMYHNHYRRLKRAYLSHRMEGVYSYLSKINQIWKENNYGKGLGAFMALQSLINDQG